MTEVETTTTLREIVRDSMALYASQSRAWVAAIEAGTVYAMQLGYTMATGTGGAYADHPLSAKDAEIIRDLLINTDRDGNYTGDRGEIARLAAEGLI